MWATVSILDFLYLDVEWLLNMAHQLCFTEPESEIKEPKGKAVRHILSVHGQHILVLWALAWQHRVEGSLVDQVQVSSERQSKGERGSVPISPSWVCFHLFLPSSHLVNILPPASGDAGLGVSPW